MKRGGAGKGNWGVEGTDAEEAVEETTGAGGEDAPPVEATEGAEDGADVPTEPEPEVSPKSNHTTTRAPPCENRRIIISAQAVACRPC